MWSERTIYDDKIHGYNTYIHIYIYIYIIFIHIDIHRYIRIYYTYVKNCKKQLAIFKSVAEGVPAAMGNQWTCLKLSASWKHAIWCIQHRQRPTDQWSVRPKTSWPVVRGPCAWFVAVGSIQTLWEQGLCGFPDMHRPAVFLQACPVANNGAWWVSISYLWTSSDSWLSENMVQSRLMWQIYLYMCPKTE